MITAKPGQASPPGQHPQVHSIAVLLTCHNRREKTLRCLRALQAQDLPVRLHIEVFLVDDGSSDGTTPAVKAEFPDVRVIPGDGTLYWCGGMRLAWKTAAVEEPDYYLLLNDDTLLYRDALGQLLAIPGSPDSLTIAVGAVSDPVTGVQTYGGHKREGDQLVALTGRVERCDTFNGNCVLIPRAVYERAGVFHDAYTHAWGDFDYGFMASKKGAAILQTPGIVAECSYNSLSGTWRDRSLSRRQRLKVMQQPKGIPWREWLTYVRRNYGWKWPRYFLSPFVRVLLGK